MMIKSRKEIKTSWEIYKEVKNTPETKGSYEELWVSLDELKAFYKEFWVRYDEDNDYENGIRMILGFLKDRFFSPSHSLDGRNEGKAKEVGSKLQVSSLALPKNKKVKIK